MTPAQLLAALGTIGWSAREMAMRLGCHRNLVTEWTAGRLVVPGSVAAWVAGLAQHHAEQPPPQDWRTRSAA